MSADATAEDFIVVDSDGHVVEPRDLWTKRMDKQRWGDLIPHYDREEHGWRVGGRMRHGGKAALQRVIQHTGTTPKEINDILGGMRMAGGYDPHERVKAMDKDGVDLSVLFPSYALFYGPLDPIDAIRNPQFVADCQRAYNDWLAEFCGAYPNRLFGAAAVPLTSIDLSVREAERAVDELGMRGIV